MGVAGIVVTVMAALSTGCATTHSTIRSDVSVAGDQWRIVTCVPQAGNDASVRARVASESALINALSADNPFGVPYTGCQANLTQVGGTTTSDGLYCGEFVADDLDCSRQ